jgi:hypothetical protein
VVLVATLVPVRAVPWLPGLPIDSRATLAAAGAGTLLLVFGSPARWARWALVPAGVALCLKVALSFATPVGFAGCYQILTPTNWSPTYYTCERSYDMPFADGYTRLDRHIDFGAHGHQQGFAQSNWLISAVNSDRYDFYRPRSQIDRNRLHLGATWNGRTDAHGSLAVSYIGEGTLRVNGRLIPLPAAYERTRTVTVPANGEVPLTLRYAWTPPTDRRHAPFAAVTVRDGNGGAVTAVGTGGVTRFAAIVLAACLALAAAAAVVMLIAELAGSPVALVALAASLVAAVLIATGHGPTGLSPRLTPLFMVLAVAPWVALRGRIGRRRMTLAAAFAVPALAVATARAVTGSTFGGVTYRKGGDDPLAYESFARGILTDQNLKGIERSFVYSPAMRYLLYAEHLITGDRDALIFAAGLVGLAAGLLFAVEVIVFRGGGSLTAGGIRGGVAIWLFVLLAIVYVGSPDVALAPYLIRSEYPTWIALLFALPLALRGRSTAAVVAVSALVGVMFTFRADQTPGLLCILAVVLLRLRPRRGQVRVPELALKLVVPALAIALLPLAHNLAYAGRPDFLPQSPQGKVSNFPLPPSKLPRLLSDHAVRAVLRSQAGGVLVIPAWDRRLIRTTRVFRWAVRVIQACLIVLPIVVLIWFRRRWQLALYPLIPFVFLAPHVIIQVYYAYPRHIVIGYLSGCLVLLVAVEELVRGRAAEPEARITEAEPANAGSWHSG